LFFTSPSPPSPVLFIHTSYHPATIHPSALLAVVNVASSFIDAFQSASQNKAPAAKSTKKSTSTAASSTKAAAADKKPAAAAAPTTKRTKALAATTAAKAKEAPKKTAAKKPAAKKVGCLFFLRRGRFFTDPVLCFLCMRN
jgi:hypothetical protein